MNLCYKSMKSCYEWKFQQKSVHRKNDCYELLLRYYYMSYYAYCLDGCKWNGGEKTHPNGLYLSAGRKKLDETETKLFVLPPARVKYRAC